MKISSQRVPVVGASNIYLGLKTGFLFNPHLFGVRILHTGLFCSTLMVSQKGYFQLLNHQGQHTLPAFSPSLLAGSVKTRLHTH